MTPPRPNPLLAMARDIKLAHSVFALPFALLATFLSAGGFPGWDKLGIIVACMVAARTYAMLVNRYADRELDKLNPRTAHRALPSGRIAPSTVLTAIAACAAALMGSASLFGILWGNWWPLGLAPLALIWLGAYSYTKRFTALCHFVLGVALGASVIGGAVAINPPYLLRPDAWLLAGFVVLWVGGFDIIYAMQDIEIDRRDNLRSIPARLGPSTALWVALGVHLLALALLGMLNLRFTAARQALGLAGPSYFQWGFIAVALLLMFEHRQARRGQFATAFMTFNGILSCVVGALGIMEVMSR